MAELFALDTNVYIHAQRDAASRSVLKQFLMRRGTRVRLPSIVAMELRAGARNDDQRAAVRDLVAPYRAMGWMIHPSADAVLEAGRVMVELAPRVRRGGHSPAPARLVADAVLATACREANVLLVTGNAGDFASIQRHLRGFRFAAPFPV